jgi:predicted AAA+ superfamily ATPase
VYPRILDLPAALDQKSLFLFGPRQTGKTTLARIALPTAVHYNLLEANTFRELSARPESIRQRLQPHDRIVVIDEIQRLPNLLNEVQVMIDARPGLRFVLTGSSARKLRRGGANLLAGRVWMARLHPLVSPELDFGRLADRLNRGGLPFVLDSSAPARELDAYIGTYLLEEIQAEGAVRTIESFSRFLPVAALANGEQINYTELGNDCQVPPRLVREYTQILVDTLIGFELPSFRATVKRKPVATAKFYLFDIGVANTLVRRGPVEPGTEGFGRALEHLIFLELRAWIDYRRLDIPLTYWRSLSQLEVDFVLGDQVAIEVKGKSSVSRRDYKGLLALDEEVPLRRKIVVCLESQPRVTDEGVEIVPVEEFLRTLWTGGIWP